MQSNFKQWGTVALLAGVMQMAPVWAEEAAAEAPAAAEVPSLTSNIGVVSEYLFRGIRQTWGNPAVQGGFDYTHASGLYAGTWFSNTSGNLYANATLEWDLYGGYRGTYGDYTYDVGLLQFIYPGADYDKIVPIGSFASKKYNSTELYLSGTWQWLNLKYSRGITSVGYFGFNNNNAYPGAFPGNPTAGVSSADTKGSWYIEANATYEFLPSWTGTLHAGHQTITHSVGLNYSDYKLGVSKAFDGGWVVGLNYSITRGTEYWRAYPSVAGNGTVKDMGKSTWFATVNRTF